MNDLMDWFKLGVAIGDKAQMPSDLIAELLKLQHLCPQAQFVVVGVLVGAYVENLWETLEMAQKGPKEA